MRRGSPERALESFLETKCFPNVEYKEQLAFKEENLLYLCSLFTFGPERLYSARRVCTGSMRTASITAGSEASSAAAKRLTAGSVSIPASVAFT